MANISAYAAKACLDWALGGAAVTRPTSRYLGLDYGTPTSTAKATEATYSGNVRQPVVFAAAASPGGSVSNSAAVNFAAVTYASTLRGFHIWDTASTGSGNLLFYGLLSAATLPTSASAFSFAAGSILLTAL